MSDWNITFIDLSSYGDGPERLSMTFDRATANNGTTLNAAKFIAAAADGNIASGAIVSNVGEQKGRPTTGRSVSR